jgi:hypothetical protein
MPLREYLYVDEKRLNSYLEQIATPVTYDKVPTYVAGVSLTGPKAEATQSRFARPYTSHEKILKVQEYLDEKKLVGQGRPTTSDNDWSTTYEFFLEHTRATRALIPPNPSVTPPFPGLAVWFASGIERSLDAEFYQSRQLYLFEDYPRDDSKAQLWGYSSGYTYLTFLLDDNPIFKRLNEQSGYRLKATGLLQRPKDFFTAVGAKVGEEREIQTLYRVRVAAQHTVHLPPDDDGNQQGDDSILVVVAYPIYISSNS